MFFLVLTFGSRCYCEAVYHTLSTVQLWFEERRWEKLDRGEAEAETTNTSESDPDTHHNTINYAMVLSTNKIFEPGISL